MFAALNYFVVTPSCSIHAGYSEWFKDETVASLPAVHRKLSINAIDKLTSWHLTRWKPEEVEWEVVDQGPRKLRRNDPGMPQDT